MHALSKLWIALPLLAACTDGAEPVAQPAPPPSAADQKEAPDEPEKAKPSTAKPESLPTVDLREVVTHLPADAKLPPPKRQIFRLPWLRCKKTQAEKGPSCKQDGAGIFLERGPGNPAWGPVGFDVDDEGQFWVLDEAGERAVAYDASGALVRSVHHVPLPAFPRSLEAREGKLYVQLEDDTSDEAVAVTLGMDGAIQAEHTEPEPPPGVGAPEIRCNDEDGSALVRVEGRQLSLSSCLQLLSVQADGSFYLYDVGWPVWKFAKDGTLLGRFVPAAGWSQPSPADDVAIDAQGRAFQLLPTKRHVDIVELAFEPREQG